MKIYSASVIISLFLSLSFSQLYYQTTPATIEQVQIQKNADFWNLKLTCPTLFTSCHFQYPSLPFGWSVSNQVVRIPIEDTRSSKKYILKSIIGAENEKTISKDIDIVFDHGQPKITLYDVNDLEESANPQTRQNSTFRPKGKQELNWLQLNGIVSYIPTIQRLDSIILSGDILQISKIFQSIASDKSQCWEKLEYLQSVSKRVDQHIRINKQQLQKQQSKILTAQEELTRLSLERQKIKNEYEEARAESKEKLEKEERELDRKRRENFSRFYTYSIVANKYLNKIKKFIDSSGVDESQLINVGEELLSDEKELVKVKKQIEQLLQKKKLLENRIAYNKKKIRDTKNVGQLSPEQLKNLEANYKRYNDMAIKYKVSTKRIEDELALLRERLKKAKEHTSFHESRLKEIQIQIQKGKRFKNGDFIQSIENVVTTLERNQQKIQNSLAQCELQSLAKQQQQTPTIIYQTAPGKLVQEYVSNLNLPPRQKLTQLFPILQKINIFSGQWIVRYGVPSTTSFVCTTNENSASGYGIITGIEKALIKIRDQSGLVMGLQIGSCSELKALSDSFVPKAGDIIDWEGELISKIVANLHKGRIFRNH